jgi:predicted short-subunit dehydrogenase-like oxidoreductase (DUF2520 family)
MHFYLRQLGHSVKLWHYKADSAEQLKVLAYESNRILLLIKDSVIEEFIATYPFLKTPHTVHFSGALDVHGIQNVHPLISFSHELFDLEFYREIPFAIFDDEVSSLTALLPGLANPSFTIPKAQKALYHGLCVASGNFTVLLWQLVGKTFLEQLGVSNNQLAPYLESVTKNLKQQWESALTGPIARHDSKTLLKNYNALKETPLKGIFEAHVRNAWPEFGSEYFDQQ